MLDLTQYPKFTSDIQGNVTNIHPVIIIKSDPPIYLSQIEETLTVDENETNFKSLNIKLPSIKESIDLESRKLKINNVTVTLSNHKKFSDLFATQNFLNVFVDIYYKSQSCTSIDDCLPIYKAIIKRVSHDYDNVKIILEDLTESIMHKEVPIGVLNSENAVKDSDINKVIPFTYGSVQKAPCVLYKEVDSSSSLQKIYTLSDRFDVPTKLGKVNPLDSYNENMLSANVGSSSYLYVHSGAYCRVMENICDHDNFAPGLDLDAENRPGKQLGIEHWDTDLEASRVFLRSTYGGVEPTNTISLRIMQVLQKRTASDFSLLSGFTQEMSDINTYYMSSEGDSTYGQWIYIGDKEKALDRDDKTWLTSASVPRDSQYIDDINNMRLGSAEDGDSPATYGMYFLDSFYNGTDVKSNYNNSDSFITKFSNSTGEIADYTTLWDEMEIVKNKYSHVHREVNLGAGRWYKNQIEFISLPDAKKLYDMFRQWYYETNAGNGVELRSWSSNVEAPAGFFKNYFNHCWGTPLDFQHHPDLGGGAYEDNLGRFLTSFDYINGEYPNYDNWEETAPIHSFGEYPLSHSSNKVPTYLYKIARNVNQEEMGTIDSNAWITFSTGIDGQRNLYDSNSIPSVEGGAITIEFYDLLAYFGYTYDDIPRYVVADISWDNTYQIFNEKSIVDYPVGDGTFFWNEIEHSMSNLVVFWNGIDPDIWGNSGSIAGGDSPFNGGRCPSDDFNASDTEVDWKNFFCSSQWHIHARDDINVMSIYTTDNPYTTQPSALDYISTYEAGINLAQGTLMPGSISMPKFNFTQVAGEPFIIGAKIVAKNKYPGSMVVKDTIGDAWLKHQADFTEYGGEASDYNVNTKIGYIFTFDSSNVEDAIENSGITYVDGKFSYTCPGSETNGAPGGHMVLSQLSLRWKEAGFYHEESDGSSLELAESWRGLNGIGFNVQGDYHSTRQEILIPYDSRTYLESESSNFFSMLILPEFLPPVSTDWMSPDDFNAVAMEYSWYTDDHNPPDNCRSTIKTKVHHMGLKHVFELEKILSKDFYLESDGRCSAILGNSVPVTSVIKDIIETELEISVGIHKSYYLVEQLMMYNNWDIAFSLKEKKNSKSLIEEIAKDTPVIPLFKSNSELGMAIIKNDYYEGDVDVVINSSDISKESFDRTKVEKVKTMVRVKHSKDYADDSHKMTLYVDAYDFYGNGDLGFEGGYKKEYYALNPNKPGDSVLEYESNYTRYQPNYEKPKYFSKASPERLRDFMLAFNCNQHNIIKFNAPLKYVNLEVSDIVRFDKLINNSKCYGEDYTQEYFRNGQIIYPYFMVTSVTKGVKDIKIECMQMHNLNRNPSVLRHGSGDFNRDGAVNGDDISAVDNYILNPHTYLTEGQLFSCDLNYDGKIDVNDIPLLEDAVEEN